MAPTIQLLGDPLFAKDPQGRPKSRIGTVFPRDAFLITLPGIHATQRAAYLQHLNAARAAAGRAPLSAEEESQQWAEAVDLIMEDDVVQIRPASEDMTLPFEADELLQRLVPKHQIRFLDVRNAKIRDAIKRRGDCWRITPLPTSTEEMRQMIEASKIAIGGREIYYYNRNSGTRLLTCQEFCGLAALEDEELRRHLAEIREFIGRFNDQGCREVELFITDRSLRQAIAEFDPTLEGPQLRLAYQQLRGRFLVAAPAGLRQDDLDDDEWRKAMFAALIGQRDEMVSEETLLGLSPEFFMQIRWLPGGRIVEGELILDEVFDEMPEVSGHPEERLYDENARELIYNLVREYGDLEYVNIGRVVNRLSRRPEFRGRRDVYLAELRQRGTKEEIVSVIRMQKWGVREHLNKGRSLLQAMFESEEYTEYVLDRRLACRQLGMNMPARVTARKIAEKYHADWVGPEGILIWSPYFERSYIRGIATDKMPHHRFLNAAFTLKFARLLGTAAAPNVIVGRCDVKGNVLFDDGDEVVVEDESRMPVEIVVSDQTGTFGNYLDELHSTAVAYAGPVNRRLDYLPEPEEFARVYLDAFVERFFTIQQGYRSHKRAFHTLFKNRRYDKGGSFAYRWDQILHRLDRTDPRELREVIRSKLLAPCGEPALEYRP